MGDNLEQMVPILHKPAFTSVFRVQASTLVIISQVGSFDIQAILPSLQSTNRNEQGANHESGFWKRRDWNLVARE